MDVQKIRTEVVVMFLMPFDDTVVNAFADHPDVADNGERGREGRLHEILLNQSVAIEAPDFL